jgi:hypothetical protein
VFLPWIEFPVPDWVCPFTSKQYAKPVMGIHLCNSRTYAQLSLMGCEPLYTVASGQSFASYT